MGSMTSDGRHGRVQLARESVVWLTSDSDDGMCGRVWYGSNLLVSFFLNPVTPHSFATL